MPKPVSAESSRYVFIDALRGIAAMGVVLGHATSLSAMNYPIAWVLPAWLAAILFYAPRGVQIFFVISGFVIAHSLRHTPMTPRACGRFILRRQIRLDPPYWTTIVVMTPLWLVQTYLHGDPFRPLWIVGVFVANLFYLQGILNLPDLIVVGWTLAVEIQFYFAFLLILFLSRRGTASKTAIALLLITGFAALSTNPNVVWEGRWAGHAWPYFVCGVLCYWAVTGVAAAWPMALMAAGLVGSAYFFGLQSQVTVGAGTALTIYVVGRLGLLRTLWRNGVVQFLGRISYSLYLSHMFVVATLQQASRKLVHGPVGSVVLCLTVIGLSLAIACVFHWLIELPSMRLAARFKDDRGPSAATGFGEEIPPIEDERVARA